jgi:molybdate transport system substrate-binding protein
MGWAEKRQLTAPGTISRLFSNRLVLIAPKDSQITVKIGPDFPLLEGLQDSRLAIADPAHVPAGTYARAALTRLKLWERVAGRTARAQDVRAALALVERGEAPLGIVYRTDAMLSKKVRIVDTFPESAHPPIVYTLAIVAGKQSKEVAAFYDFLRSRAAAAIFGRFGFQPGR